MGRSGRESVTAIDRFCRNTVGPPEWECEAMGSVVWVQCATSAECINISIAESMVTDTLVSRSHHGSTFNKSCILSYKLCTGDDIVKIILRVDQVLVVVVITGRITVKTTCWSWL